MVANRENSARSLAEKMRKEQWNNHSEINS